VRLFCKHAEKDPDEKSFQIMTRVTFRLKGVMQAGHDSDCLQVQLIGRFYGAYVVTGNEVKLSEMIRELSEGKLNAVEVSCSKQRKVHIIVWFEVVERDALKI